jgi:hypothetical protein
LDAEVFIALLANHKCAVVSFLNVKNPCAANYLKQRVAAVRIGRAWVFGDVVFHGANSS